MNKKLLYTGLVLFVVGLIGRIYANNASYVDANGMVHDSAWLPIGTLMALVGLLFLVITGIQYSITRKNK